MRSDHKPVQAIYEIAAEFSPTPRENRLAQRSPFPIDESYRVKSLFGAVMDMIAGYLWYFAVFVGFGSDRLGLALILLGLLTVLGSRRYDSLTFPQAVSSIGYKESGVA